MACKQFLPAIVGHKPPSLGGQVGARSLAAAFMLGAGVAATAVIAAVSSATAQELEWATRAGGAGDSEIGFSIAITPRGESYVTGHFAHTAIFGRGEPNQTTLTAESDDPLEDIPDVFVAKYDRNGALLWVRRAGGTDFDRGHGIATTPRGESYVSGFFAGTATFGQGEPNQTTLTAAGANDIFVAKFR